MFIRAVGPVLAVFLVACGGVGASDSVGGAGGGSGGSSDSSIANSCTTISGGTTTTQFSTSGCINCAVADASRAIDNDLNTAANITLPGASVGSASFRATAQSGVVFPANNIAAVVLSAGPSDNRVHVLTYLGGVLQDDGTMTGNTTAIQNGVLIVGLRTILLKNSLALAAWFGDLLF